MSSIKLLIPIFTVFTLITGCTKVEPTACFSFINYYSNDSLFRAGNDIQFTDCSLNAEQYFWDFGDGSTSTALSPTHIYADSGTFTVLHRVYNESGELSDEKSTKIKVSLTPIAFELHAIQLNDFPEKDNYGNYWDAQNDGPDISFRITSNYYTTTVDFTTVINDCIQGSGCKSVLSSPTRLAFKQFDLNIYDYDFDNYNYVRMVSMQFDVSYIQSDPNITKITLENYGYSVDLLGNLVYN